MSMTQTDLGATLSQDTVQLYLPVIITSIALILILWFLNWVLLRRHKSIGTQARIPRQVVLLLLTLFSILIIIVLFPMSDSTRGQIITLVGVVTTGVIALASTTFVANVMAGLMLTVVKSFMPGDFIRVGEQFGRVTERGLFHTEIQTEDRDLTTLPNLHLATNPVTVVHKAGTIISAELSLGYDVPRTKVEELLMKAAQEANLLEPFVLVISLDDYSVVYRVSGFLTELESLITSRSNLKKKVLDVLHQNNIEIVSPSFMYQRQLPEWENVIPVPDKPDHKVVKVEEGVPEEIIFDKANVAAKKEDVRIQIDDTKQLIEKLLKDLKSISEEERLPKQQRLEKAESDLEKLNQQLDLMQKVKQK